MKVIIIICYLISLTIQVESGIADGIARKHTEEVIYSKQYDQNDNVNDISNHDRINQDLTVIPLPKRKMIVKREVGNKIIVGRKGIEDSRKDNLDSEKTDQGLEDNQPLKRKHHLFQAGCISGYERALDGTCQEVEE